MYEERGRYSSTHSFGLSRGGEYSVWHSGRFISWKRISSTPWVWGFVGLRGQGKVLKKRQFELSSLALKSIKKLGVFYIATLRGNVVRAVPIVCVQSRGHFVLTAVLLCPCTAAEHCCCERNDPCNLHKIWWYKVTHLFGEFAKRLEVQNFL
jgi:hypothetical protein